MRGGPPPRSASTRDSGITDVDQALRSFAAAGVLRERVSLDTARMTHGSTLCRVAMAWVLARSDRARSWGIFRDALLSDIAAIQGGTTREGVHLGAMAGTLDLLQRCYTGLEIRDSTVRFTPRLPDELTELRFGFRYRNQRVDAAITRDRLELRARPEAHPAAITVVVAGRVLELQPHESRPPDIERSSLRSHRSVLIV